MDFRVEAVVDEGYFKKMVLSLFLFYVIDIKLNGKKLRWGWGCFS